VDADRFERAIRAIDAANADDPRTIVIGGVERPKEVAHAELVSGWVTRLDPNPSEALLLAARAHHLRRWTIPRSSYPQGRASYLKWRKALHEQHAHDVAEILRAAGYDGATVARVQDLVRKHGLGADPEMQVLEDAMCLVFIETQLADLAARLDPEKLPRVIAKTKQKMSPEAITWALQLPLSDAERELLLS
jgi:Domain of unknown function (DUF4202)